MTKNHSRATSTLKSEHLSCQSERLECGVTSLNGKNFEDIIFGLGVAHGRERPLQMEMTRLIGEGRLSECLILTKESEQIDIFMRQMGFFL